MVDDLFVVQVFAVVLSFGTVVYMRNSTPTWFWQMSWFTGVLACIGAIATFFSVRPLLLASAVVMIAIVSFYLVYGVRQIIRR